MVQIQEIGDETLRDLANGRAEAELRRRQQQRREREKQRAEAQAEQAKQEYVRSLCGDCLLSWVKDPRTGPRTETKVYDEIADCCGWLPAEANMGIDEAVELSKREKAQRRRQREARMHQVRGFGPTVTVPGVGEIPVAGIGLGFLALWLLMGR